MGLGASTIISIVSILVSTISLTVHIFTAVNQRKKTKRQARIINKLLSNSQNCTCNEIHSEYRGQLVITNRTETSTTGKILVIKKSYLDTGKEALNVVSEIPFAFA